MHGNHEESRRIFNLEFKAKAAAETLKERETLKELDERLEIHPNHISQRKQEFLKNPSSVLEPTKLKKNTKITL